MESDELDFEGGHMVVIVVRDFTGHHRHLCTVYRAFSYINNIIIINKYLAITITTLIRSKLMML